MRRPVADIIVIGAGGSGIPLAVRAAEAGARVLLMESGSVPRTSADLPPELRDAGTLRGAHPESPFSRTFQTLLHDRRPYSIVRGRFAGGSTSTNGGYFVRARREDFDRWSQAVGAAEWSYGSVLPALRRIESDAQFGASPLHGAEGPMVVTRDPLTDRLSRGFLDAGSHLNLPFEPDKNSDQTPGIGPIPQNRRDDVRWSTAWGYLWSRAFPASLEIAELTTASRVVFSGTQVIGVESLSPTGAEFIACAEVVLCAGAWASPQLLLLSGIGPPRRLAELGIQCIADRHGVGMAFDDHPSIDLNFEVDAAAVDFSGSTLTVGLNVFLEHGEVELLPLMKPVDYLLSGTLPTRGSRVTLPLRVSTARPHSRGSLTLSSTDPSASPVIHHRYLSDRRDLHTLLDGVRFGMQILTWLQADGNVTSVSPALTHGTDKALGSWIHANIGTSVHTCATTPMGAEDDSRAVVDTHGRVHGVTGLRVADTSILPDVPSRGPANTAVLIGERIAELMTGE